MREESGIVDPVDLRCLDIAPRGNHEPVGREHLVADLDLHLREEPRLATSECDALGADIIDAVPVADRSDHRVDPATHGGPVHSHAARLDAEPVGGCRTPQRPGGLDEGVHRVTAVIQAGSAKLVRLDQGDNHAGRRRAFSDVAASRAPADHDQVER